MKKLLTLVGLAVIAIGLSLYARETLKGRPKSQRIETSANKAKILCIEAPKSLEGLDTQVSNIVDEGKVVGFSAGPEGKYRCYLLFYGRPKADESKTKITCMALSDFKKYTISYDAGYNLLMRPRKANCTANCPINAPYCLITDPNDNIKEALKSIGTKTKEVRARDKYDTRTKTYTESAITYKDWLENTTSAVPGKIYDKEVDLINAIQEALKEDK